uniref:DDE-type integrase/transposase/recombinase n=1 Tax=Polaromonas sp. E3S TaxID=1840265 RepID=UPI0015E80BD7|nr:DDE-type integrase/transposase/recombinase [Polaromonas sp. E3S]
MPANATEPRAVVGWQMSGRIDSKLVCDALQAAILTRGKPTGVMVHTDQGSQYVSNAYRKTLRESLLIQSMSRRGDCWNTQSNAVAESFFATLKKQAIHGEYFATREQAKQAVFEYIEAYYNRIRRHSTVGWLSPLNFENLYYQSLEDSAVH